MYSILLILAFMAVPAYGRTCKETVIRYTEEKINNMTFAHRVDIQDCVTKERWAINGKPVTYEEYEQLILEAEQAERKLERQKKEELDKQQELEEIKKQEFARSARLQIMQKRLQELVTQIEIEFSKIKDPLLQPYLQFESSFSAQDLNHVENDLLPKAHLLIKAAESEEELKALSEQLEAIPSHIRSTFRVSVKNAIAKCDDTKLLKSFLEIVD